MLIQPLPPGFVAHQHKFSFNVKGTEAQVWKWLNDPKTFTDSQVWPYRVEFYSPDPDNIPNGFHEGVLNIHHGPLVNFSGVLTEIVPDKYRDLQYYCGSYAFSLRWIRPYRLEFWTEDSGEETTITCALSSYTKPFISGLWNNLQKLFWASFKRWARKAVR